VDDVRRLAGIPESIPLLKLREGELKHAFKISPWTEEVPRVSYRPFGVTVHLVYHRPVALVEVIPQERYLINESAIILPKEDIDRDLDQFARQEVLITIKGDGLASPRNPLPGIEWKCRPGLKELAPGNGQIPAAAKLAAFLSAKMRAVDRMSEPGLNFLYINPMDDAPDYRGLFLWNPDEKTYVLWGEAPGAEKPGSLSAEEKWRRICDWSRSVKHRTLPKGCYWTIAGPGLISNDVRQPPASARRIPPRHDSRAILTKDPGQRR
jgi:hypothetical protein